MTRAGCCALGLAAVLTWGAAGADDPRDYTLEETLRVVLASGLGSERAAVEVALQRARLERAGSAFDWRYGASASVGRRDFHPATGSGTLSSDTESETYISSRIGASRELRNGLQIAPAVTLTSGFDSDADAATAGLSSGFGIGLTMPLSHWGDMSAAVSEERVAEARLAASEAALQYRRQAVLAGTAADFWQLLGAGQRAQLAARQVTLQQRAVEVARDLARQGEISAAALVAAQAALRRRQLAMNGAREDLLSRRLALAERLGAAVGAAPLPGAAGDFPDPRLPAGDDAGYLQRLALRAEAQRPDFRAAAARRHAALTGLQAARNRVRPELELRVGMQEVTLAYQRAFSSGAQDAATAEAQAELTAAQLEEALLRRDLHAELRGLLARLRLNHANFLLVDDALRDMRGRLAQVQGAVAAGQVPYSEEAAVAAELAELEGQLGRYRLEHALALVTLRLAAGDIEAGDAMQADALAAIFQTLP